MGPGAARLKTLRKLGSREVLPFLVLFVLALALRTVELSVKPMHHDESLDAWFSWLIAQGNAHRYDPAYHGPLRFYLLAAVQRLFGSGELQVRIIPALLGSAMVLVPASLQRFLGRAGAVATSAMLAVSPIFIYFSRFTREDIYVALVTLALVALAFRLVDQPDNRKPIALGALLAVSFALKETTFITVFIAGSFAAVLLAATRTRYAPEARNALEEFVTPVRRLGPAPWLWAGTTFLGLFAIAFTGAFTDLESLHRGLFDGLTYWLGQHEVGRGGQPWFFYLVLLASYELPGLLLAVIGGLAVVRRPSLFGLFIVWSLLANVVIYSWAGEKYPWLVVHSALPLLVLAGLGVKHTWESSSRRLRWMGRALVAAAIASGLVAGVGAAILRPADGRELLVAVQTTTDVPPIVEEMRRLDRKLAQERGTPLKLVVDESGSATWPWAWYFRDLPGASYAALEGATEVPPADALIVSQNSEPTVRTALGGFEGRRFRLRIHWSPDYSKAMPGSWLRWFFTREPWSEIGSYDEWIFIRRGISDASSDLSTS